MTDLLTPQQLHDYQKECVLFQLYHPDSMLWLQMGLGKTPITLTTIVDRMNAGMVQKTLIFGPLRVIQAVWAREARKWTHTKQLRFSVIHGTKEKRLRALFTDADIYLINYDNMNWLAQTLDHYYVSQDKPLPFQMVVYDEVSKIKNSTTLRMAGGNRDRKDRRGEHYKIKVTGWRKMIDSFAFRTGLTGMPAGNGYIDLHGQFLVVDGGKRLGPYITQYRDNFFASDYMGWSYSPTPIGRELIEHKIADITIKMDSKDYLDMPEVKIVNMMVELPDAARKAYKEIEIDLFTRLDTGSEIELFSKTSISNKCLQFCNGSPYLSPGSPQYEPLHDAKLDALEEILEEAGGSPVLCGYSFKADAERIMTRFKKYNPVNMTAAAAKDTEKIINKWNAGGIRLMIGHPRCLHPKTKVLTQLRGWIRIVDVTTDDKVFDGVEFVSHDGCSYSGHEKVIEVFGLTMTPNHKLLIAGEWRDAKNVRDSKDIKKEALYKYKGNDKYISAMLTLRNCVRNTSPKRDEAQQDEKAALSTLYSGCLSPHDRDTNMEYMVRNEASCKRFDRQGLCGSRDRNVSNMGRLQSILQGYARWLQRRTDYRKERCEPRIFKRKLHMDYCIQTASKQTQQSIGGIQWGEDAPCRTMQKEWDQQDDVNHATEQRDECGRSSGRCKELIVRKEQRSKERNAAQLQAVYDLVNCGPRGRFLIRNDDGEAFISHNSMGHGVDGLQEAGSIVAWFGIPWSLDDYEQFIARIARQGQTRPVSVIRILCKDSVDLAVVDAQDRKTGDQEGLKAAIQRYRDGITTNELTVNFF